MLKKVLPVLVAILVVFFVIVALQPNEFKITRTTQISAPAADVFAQVNNLHHFNSWSPYANRDPQAKNTYEGPENGVGAAFSWSGNKDIGEGKMTITESQPHDLIRMKLDFIKPFTSTADVEFTFKEEGGQTVTSWTIRGRNTFLSKMFCMFMNQDKMIGGDFEKGLAALKTHVESAP